MEGRLHIAILVVLLICVSANAFAAYEANSTKAAQWLVGMQTADGSWGSTEAEKFLYTAEVVDALQAAGIRTSAYYRGVTWLENHAALNSDYLSRWVRVLSIHGDDVSAALRIIESDQNTLLPGHSAWGLSQAYQQSPLDTALVLRGLSGETTSANLTAAISYLKSAQLNTATDHGWPIGRETSSDAFTTALVIKVLAPMRATDASLTTPVANAITTLQSAVTASSPVYLRAHAAHAAMLAGNTNTAITLLAGLVQNQGTNGSWSDRVYDTALSLRAFAAADGLDTTAAQTLVVIPDAQLRAAINATLGRNAMDSISRGEIQQLVVLNAQNRGIRDLTGLEWAANLVSLDLRNNNIASTLPLYGLTQLSSVLLDGNPANPQPPPQLYASIDNDIPTLPEWAAILMGLILMGLIQQRNNKHQTTGTL